MVLSLRKTVSKEELRSRFCNSNIVSAPVLFDLNKCVKAILKTLKQAQSPFLLSLKAGMEFIIKKQTEATGGNEWD